MVVRAQLSRRQPQGDRRDGRDAARGADQRRRGHALHEQPGHHRRRDDARRSRSGSAPIPTRRSSWCRTAWRRPCRACPRRCASLGVTTVKSSPDLTMVVHLLSPNDRYDMTYLRNYARAQRQGSAGAHRRRRPGAAVRRRRLCDAGLARSAEGRRARPVGRATWCARSAAQNVQVAAGVVGASPSDAGLDLQLSINAQGRLQTEEEFGDIIVKTGANGEVTRLRDVARIELGAARLRAALAARQQAGGRRSPIFQAPGSNALAALGQRPRDDGRAEDEHARGRGLPDRLRPDAIRARLDRGGGPHAARGGRAGRAGRDPVPADLARLDHSAGRGAGLDRRHLRRACMCSASRSTRCRCSGWCWRSASWSTTPSSWSRTSSATSRQGLSPREADLPGDGRSDRARSSRSRWCCARCSCRWPSSAA